jgi:two-component system chemotaxis response regulator CheB
MANRDILAIGTSAGGVEALLFLARHFPHDFPAAVLITIHLPSQFHSTLDEILTRSGPLRAVFADEGETLSKGRIYIAPPGRHMLVDGERLSLGSGARENNSRPAIDPMLRSAAVCCGGRTVGVVLTGTLGDGASGLWALEQSGGMTVIQDPEDAAFPEMPLHALNRVRADHVVHLAEMPALLAKLAAAPAGDLRPVPAKVKFEVEIARGERATMSEMDRIGRRSVLSCPDCGGVMWEVDDGPVSRFRCHVGHAYTADLMSLALDDSLRRALAMALRVLDERAGLVERLRQQDTDRGRHDLASSWAARGREFQREARVLVEALERLDRMATRAAAE